MAVSDPTGTIAQPLATVAAEPKDSLAERLAAVATQNEVARIVVGLPLRMDGSRGPEAKAAEGLATELRRLSRLPVELVDERLTTAAAERSLIGGGVKRAQRRQAVDRVAAALLLQTHLDSRR